MNPAKKITITGINGGKNIASNSGWVVDSIDYCNWGKTEDVSSWVSYPRGSTNASLYLGILAAKKSSYIYIHFYTKEGVPRIMK